MKNPPRKKLLPRGRIGKAVPIQPLDFEPKKRPFVPTKQTKRDLWAAITLVVSLVILLLMWWAVEYLKSL